MNPPEHLPGPGDKLGQALVVLVLGFVAVLGVIFSLGVKSKNNISTEDSFPWKGPVHAIQNLWSIRKKPMLNIAVWANCFIWLVGSLLVLLINEMGKSQFGFSNTITSSMVVSLMLGISVGALISAHVTEHDRWYKYLSNMLILMAVCLGLMFFIP